MTLLTKNSIFKFGFVFDLKQNDFVKKFLNKIKIWMIKIRFLIKSFNFQVLGFWPESKKLFRIDLIWTSYWIQNINFLNHFRSKRGNRPIKIGVWPWVSRRLPIKSVCEHDSAILLTQLFMTLNFGTNIKTFMSL